MLQIKKKELETILENIAQQGCNYCNFVIRKIKNKQKTTEINDLNSHQIQWLHRKLVSIMKVYKQQ
jgi:hypothetical protein